ncbi:MAG: amidohydrolase family protein [Gammaproteobacteria bacterium]|nr:amidohydrolase family protein [Gammaproteobacteria bacterium]
MKILGAAVRLSVFLSSAVLVAGCGAGKDSPAPAAADTVFVNGRVYTVDTARSWAEAVAVSGDRIVYVGANDGALALAGDATAVVDLGGRMMLPGFQDSHIHPLSGGVEASACDLNAVTGITEYRSIIAEYAAANPDVPWILGGGWAMSDFGPGGAPHKGILDELVPDRPVFLSSRDGHSGWANSRALEIAGITRDTPDPEDGRIDRDPESGEPIGALQEGAMSLVTRHIPPTSDEVREAGLRYSVKMLNGLGITSMQEAAVQEDAIRAYKALESRGELTMRVVGSIWWDRDRGIEQVDELVALREKYDNGGLFRPTTVKIMQDGVMENYTAVMLEPYLVPSGTRGIPMLEPELLKRAVTALDAAGFQVHFHAIGDGAVRQCLDAVEEAEIVNGGHGHRHHISHLQMIDPADIPRFAELQVIANFQPLWAYPDEYVTELTIPFIGEERARWMYPIRSVQEAGGTIAFGSDWSVSTPNVFHQVETAVTRMSSTGEPAGETLNPQEAIDLASAIDAFTINAAFLNKHEDQTGSIEVGKLADLIVLDRNLFEIDPQEVSETTVLLTVFGGEPVHGSYADL